LYNNEDWIINSDYSIEDGKHIMNKLLKMDKRPTAVMAINDFIAIGAMKAARAADIKVPEQMSILGFDGTYLSEVTEPQITTVSQNYEELGKNIIQVLVNIIDKKEVKKTTIIKTKLIIRNSCSNRQIYF
jgi:DNA-binding LacI/PurR family transcriptional regulator